jgi:hypothetical protein
MWNTVGLLIVLSTCTNIVRRVQQGKSVLIWALSKSMIPWMRQNCSCTAESCVLWQHFGGCMDIRIILHQNHQFVCLKYAVEHN